MGGRLLLPTLICLLFCAALAYPTHLRAIGGYWTETDFYAFYAPDADRIAAGQFVQNTFNPPGFPLLLALVSPLTGDHFMSGKWIALLSGALVGLAAFCLFQPMFGRPAALLAVPVILLSGEFTQYSIQATTDVVFLLPCILTMIALTRPGVTPWFGTVLAALLTGIAYLVRYNGVFLVIPALVAILTLGGVGRPARLRMAAVYLLLVLIVVSPWLWLNYTHHGSPFFSTNYQNVASVTYGRSQGFGSLADVVLHDPARFATRYVARLIDHIGVSFGASLALLPVGPLAGAGILLTLWRRRERGAMLLLVSALAHFLVMAMTHRETRYHFYALICWAGLAGYALFELVGWLRARRGLPRVWAGLLVTAIALLILVPSSGRVYLRVSRLLEREPREVIDAAKYLKGVRPPGAVIVAHKPHLAYLSGGRWVRFPAVGDLDALRGELQRIEADYLVYDRLGQRLSKHMKVLAVPDPAVAWLEPVFHDVPKDFVLYAVRPEARPPRTALR